MEPTQNQRKSDANQGKTNAEPTQISATVMQNHKRMQTDANGCQIIQTTEKQCEPINKQCDTNAMR